MITIAAPIGGFANHVSWLLWTHKCYSKTIPAIELSARRQEIYQDVRQDNWPHTPDQLHTIKDPHTVQQLKNWLFLDCTVDNRAQWVCDVIYNNERSWHNWLWMEWRYRDCIPEFRISHDIDDATVVCTIDPNVAYRNYIKINSSMNNRGYKRFVDSIQEFNTNANTHSGLVLDNTVLFNKVLDRDYYKKLITHFDIEDEYDSVQLVHNAWYNCQMRSEQDFLAEVKRLYGKK